MIDKRVVAKETDLKIDNKQHKGQLANKFIEVALVYWCTKTKDMSPETITWLNVSRERRLNLLAAIEGGLSIDAFWQETAVLMIQLFHFMERNGYWSSWIPTLEKAIKLCPQRECYEQVRLQSQLSQLYRKSARFDDADQLFSQLLQYALDSDNKQLMASIYREQAVSFIARNQLDLAEESITTAYKYRQSDLDKQFAFICETFGDVYRRKGKYSDSLSYYERALPIRESYEDPYAIACTLNDMALVYEGLGEYEFGLSTYNKALEVLEDTNNYQSLKFLIRINKGVTNYRQNRLAEAEQTFLGINLFELKRSGELISQGLALQNIGNVKLKRMKHEEARPYIEEAIIVFESIHDEVRLANSVGTLAEILVLEGKVKEATPCFDKAISLLEKYPEHIWGQKLLADFIEQRNNC